MNLKDEFLQNVLVKFDENIPSIFVNHIETTYKKTKSHHSQLRGIQYLYRSLRYCLPGTYVSKSGIRVGDVGPFLCRNPYEDGTIENALLLLEKQYFDSVYLLLGGSYRPIMGILRYMIQLSTWVAVSIFDKKQLTGNEDDTNSAMSHIQFEEFLRVNEESTSKIKSFEISSEEKKTLRVKQGLAYVPDKYISKLEYGNRRGMKVIKFLYSYLSRYSHSNVWHRIRLDGEDGDSDVDMGEPFVSRGNFEGFHRSLTLIIRTHEIIFFLLIASAFENIGFKAPDLAKEYVTSTLDKFKTFSKSLKFTKVEKLLDDLINRKIQSENEKNELNDEEFEEHEDCPKCGMCLYVKGEECIGCHILAHGQGGDTEDFIY